MRREMRKRKGKRRWTNGCRGIEEAGRGLKGRGVGKARKMGREVK